MSFAKIELDKGWKFKQSTRLNNATASDEFLPVSQFPTVVQMDLIHHNLIPDPYIGVNEVKNLWVGEADWVYQTSDVPKVDIKDNERAVLVFDGLDTTVEVYLNGELILSAKDMFIPYRVDVTDNLKGQSGSSVLELRFASNVKKARSERERLGYHGKDSDIAFGGSERLFLRKAQFHWGWDWGPVVNTCGPYKGIRLEVSTSSIDEFQVVPEVSEALDSAEVTVRGVVSGNAEAVEVSIVDPSNNIVGSANASVADGKYNCTVKIEKPALWYPYMYGDQPLYTAKAEVTNGTHSVSKSFGIRKMRLVQEPLQTGDPGTSFTFEINGKSVFGGGTNWIPGDVLVPRLTDERYKSWIKLAKEGNQSMIRIWGGGVVEPDVFYDMCDKEGILIWADMQFSCGNYPSHDDYLELVKQEIHQQAVDTGHHPSLVLMCGNNEDYLLADRFGWKWDRDDNEGPWDDTDFPNRKIYEQVMPEMFEKLLPHIPYHRSSPYGGYMSNDRTIGDTHIWQVWHHSMDPYQKYGDWSSRFVSEFGFESCPNIRTLTKAIPDKRQQHSQSRYMDAHDKGPGNTRRYGMYMAENFRFRMDPLEDYVYCTQVLQAEAMLYALMSFRRKFYGNGKNLCSGGLVWQLNDVWPGTSWALVDVNLYPKLAYYSVKHALAPVTVGIERTVTKETGYILRSHAAENGACSVWATTVSSDDQEYTLQVRGFNVETGHKVDLGLQDIKVTLSSNRTSELLKNVNIPDADNTVIVAYLMNGKEQVARFVNWPEPFKYLAFAEAPEITVDSTKDGYVSITSNVPLKGVLLYVDPADGDDAKWNDNYLDLVPGEKITVGVSQLNGRKVSVRWLCSWESKPVITSL